MSDPRPTESPRETSNYVARQYFAVTDQRSRAQAIRSCLLGAVAAWILTPALFYLRFRQIGPLGWGTTVFFSVYLLLSAIGLFFGPRTEFHSPVALKGDWLDRIGAFWLVGCVFGPFLGWIVTSGAFPVTISSWRWLYGFRVLLAAVVPVALALPLTRYVRGKAALIALPLLVGITFLPISSAMNVSLDLWEGPTTRTVGPGAQLALFLRHTERLLSA
jgi:hypothetical protein